MKSRRNENMQTRFSTVGPPSLLGSLNTDQEFRNRQAESPRNFTQAGKNRIRLSSLNIAHRRLVQPSTKGQLFLSPATAQSKRSYSSSQRESEDHAPHGFSKHGETPSTVYSRTSHRR